MRKLKISYNSIIEFSLIFYLIAMLAYNSAISYDPIILRVAKIVLVCGLFLNLIRPRAARTRTKKYVVWCAVVYILFLLSVTWSKDNSLCSSVLLQYMPFNLLFGLSLCLHTDNKDKLLRVVKGIAFAGFYLAVRCLIYTEWNQVFTLNYDFRTMFAAKMTEGIVNYNTYTAPLTILSILTLFIIKNTEMFVSASGKGLKRKRLPFILMYSVQCIAIILSGSRKAIVICVLSFVAVNFFGRAKNNLSFSRIKNIMIVLLFTVVVFQLLMNNATFYQTIGKGVEDAVSSVLDSSSDASITDGSILARSYLRERASEVFQDNPVLGVGVDNFRAFNSYGKYAHDNFWEILADFGIIGFVLYYSLYAWLLCKSASNLFFSKSKNMYAVMVFMVILFMLIMEYGQITYYLGFAHVVLALSCICMKVGMDKGAY